MVLDVSGDPQEAPRRRAGYQPVVAQTRGREEDKSLRILKCAQKACFPLFLKVFDVSGDPLAVLNSLARHTTVVAQTWGRAAT